MTDEVAPHIKGERQETTTEPPKRQPPVREQLDDALARLTDKRAGNFERRTESDAKKAYRLRNEDDGVAALRVEDGLARERAERDAETKRQAEAEKADEHIRQASEWHPDDQQTLGQLESEVEQFEDAKSRLAQAQRFAKEHPDRISAQQRQDLQQANERLLQRQQELQQTGAKVQQAATVKSAEVARRKLYAEFPELADSDMRDRLVAWAQKRGIPKDVTLSETRPEVVGAALKQMQSEEKQKREKRINRPRTPPIRDNTTPREGLTVQQARDRLKTKGSVNDALNLLAIERQRARETKQ